MADSQAEIDAMEEEDIKLRLGQPERVAHNIIRYEGENFMKISPALQRMHDALEYEREMKLNSFKNT